MKAVNNSLDIRNQRLNPDLSLNFIDFNRTYSTAQQIHPKQSIQLSNIHTTSEELFCNYLCFTIIFALLRIKKSKKHVVASLIDTGQLMTGKVRPKKQNLKP